MSVIVMFSLLMGQVALPTAPRSTWDGVPGGEVVRTDAATGEITYPMGQQPADALALGCIFGRYNVRCPRPVEDEPQSEPTAAPDTPGSDRWGIGAMSLFTDMAEAQPSPAAAPRPEPPAADPAPTRPGCRRETYRDPNGGGFSARMVCGSGDQRMMNQVMDALRPSGR